MNKELSRLGLRRHNPVGKKIGSKVWLHVSYLHIFISDTKPVLSHKELIFTPDIARVDLKTGEICLIECSEFYTVHEPKIERTLLIKPDGSIKKGNENKDPLIYHHKWMFVKDDFNKFDVEEAKKRSIAWKSVLGTNKDISNKIGRLSFWIQWTKCLNKEIIPRQEHSSANTSINSTKIPKVFTKLLEQNLLFKNSRNLDLGGGKFNNVTEMLSKLDIENLIYDPFNRSKEHNLNVLNLIEESKSDTVTISNVLNVIKEDDNKNSLIYLASKSLKPGGFLYITVYEGNKTGIGKVTRKDQWQENKKLSEYLDLNFSGFNLPYISKGIIICEKSNI